MSNKSLYVSWGCLFIICALLGFIPEPEGVVKVLLVLAAAVFFVPGWILYYRARKSANLPALQLLRTLCLISLVTTLIFLVLNFLSINAGEAAGSLLYGFLVIFSAPMVCSQYWIASLFLWACLLMASLSAIKKAKKQLSQR